ncbi:MULTISPECIES: ATP-binding protein [unclassified Pseudoalteromonas]|uniref:ATP-binding protein n=1 Tax=unclassified Pseudoalteromonas TaxID=194690 RepID=UPI0004160880|nr:MULTISPECIES: ATP-binding protein [unclassified Pseudoalteromonas]PCC14198.1 AAA family ATPase [Pseudoalteromonas sp. JB197]SJN16550.1 Transposon Tn7 transposition protein tnsC [Pseudoalteromonas sp. JB197]
MPYFENAVYINAEITEYEGHPLINALPPINSPQDTAQLIRRIPEVRPEEVVLPAYIRRHAMLRIMDGFLYPTKAHLQLEQTISSMIRQGYLSRNIADKSYQETLNNTADFQSMSRNAGNEALVSSVIGCSGAGKSTAVEAILSGYPQVIMHSEYQHVQLVWLKVECPHDASIKSLCINFFRALDSALDNNSQYEKQYVKPRANAEVLLGDFARIAALHSIGLLVIDEIQHLERSNSGVSEKILRFFVQLTNTIKLPILFVGTPKAYEVFSPSMRSARRASQFGSINWNRFNTADKTGKGSDWDRFFTQLWSLQWFKSSQPLTDEIKNIFWDYSQGIAHVAVTLFYLCQTRAVTIGREIINEQLVETIFDEELSMIRPMIRALQSGVEDEIQKYADLEIPKASLIQHDKTYIEPEGSTDSKDNNDDLTKLQQLTNMLGQMGIGDDIAPVVAEQALEELPNSNLFDLIAHIKNLQEKEQPKPQVKQSKVVKLTPKYIDKDLRLMIGNKGTTYKTMKNEGAILRLADYL